MKDRSCRHHRGPHNFGDSRNGHTECKAGVSYRKCARVDEMGLGGCAVRLPCVFGNRYVDDRTGITAEKCVLFEPWTAEELAEQEKDIEHRLDCMKRGVSHCCEVVIDESRVITEGQHKGHGPRFCAKCKKLQYMV